VSNIRIIRRRIRGTQSMAKITKAMQMIAASKMRKAQDRGLAGRPYSEKITEVLAALAALPREANAYPLLEIREPAKRVAIVHITPDRGLTGGLVANVNRRTAAFIIEQGTPVELVAVGRKGLEFMRRTGQNVIAEFTALGDKPGFLDTLPVSRILIEEFTSRKVDAVYLAYARFTSTLVQTPVVQRLLPVQPAPAKVGGLAADYIFEPDAAAVLGALLPRYVEMRVYHAILESIASEQSARMSAMRNATENAEELITDLTLVYNKARQESITTELLDIMGGAAAVS
jgi:F-type H+-transporting ATPase subunit gamma